MPDRQAARDLPGVAESSHPGFPHVTAVAGREASAGRTRADLAKGGQTRRR